MSCKFIPQFQHHTHTYTGSSKIHRAKEQAEKTKSSHKCNFILKSDKLKIAPPIFRSRPRAFSI